MPTLDDAVRYRFADFTELEYEELLRLASQRYRFVRYGERCDQPHILWRHDVDLSVHRALRTAQIEAEMKIQATYFLLPHSAYYNLLEKPVFECVQRILQQGHSLGLHFDMAFYPPFETTAHLEEKLAWEKRLLEELFSCQISVFSFHNPDVGNALQYDQDVMAGMINTYGRSLRENYAYCSDSNGYWRYQRLRDVLTVATEPRLHVLTHPGWWVPQPMSPRERISRCIDGRAQSLHRQYDDFLVEAGRSNVGK